MSYEKKNDKSYGTMILSKIDFYVFSGKLTFIIQLPTSTNFFISGDYACKFLIYTSMSSLTIFVVYIWNTQKIV